MIRRLALALILAASAIPADAALPVGAKAPDVKTMGALGGKTFRLHLAEQLRSGPVVLYFYPKAFTGGCTQEAHAFAEAHDQFAAAGATVIGMSADDLPTLQRFSTEACRSKFAVGVATPAIIRAYDVALRLPAAPAARTPASVTSRTSYVIARDGRIRLVHSDMDYRDHVRLTLEAVQGLRRAR